MVPFPFIIFLIVVGLIIASIVLGVWLLVTIIKAIAGAIFGGTRAVLGVGRRPYQPPMLQPCGQVRCHAMNPPGARFCRRCGKALGQTMVLRAA